MPKIGKVTTASVDSVLKASMCERIKVDSGGGANFWAGCFCGGRYFYFFNLNGIQFVLIEHSILK